MLVEEFLQAALFFEQLIEIGIGFAEFGADRIELLQRIHDRLHGLLDNGLQILGWYAQQFQVAAGAQQMQQTVGVLVGDVADLPHGGGA